MLTSGIADDILPSIFQEPQQQQISGPLHSESTIWTEDVKKPELVIYTPAPSSRASSFVIPSTSSEEEHHNLIDYDSSPPPLDEKVVNTWNERRYHLLLMHDYHPSRRSYSILF